MDTALSDPSDWLKTSLPPFSALENALRCQVCKDFYTTPMVTSCSHTFCSICIRRCLSSDGKCPACRTNDQASKLRRNWALEEVVGAFKTARPTALDIATKDKADKQEEPSRPNKRRRTEKNAVREDLTVRTTRSQRKRAQETEQAPATIDIADHDSDGDYHDDDHMNTDNDPPEDGLVACPICQKRMKEEAVFNHIGTQSCTTSSQQQKHQPPRPTPSLQPSSSSSKPLPDRLTELNYSLLNEKALRKKLTELGIPSTGTKPQLSKRHTEWVNLWNANVDAGAPRSKRELLDGLRKWDRSVGREPDQFGTANQVMRKDFDAKAWSSGNKDDFARLIEQARQGRKKQVSATEKTDQEKDAMNVDQQPQPLDPEQDLPDGYHDASVPQENYPEPESESTPSSAQPQHAPPKIPRATSLPEHFADPGQKSMAMFEVPGQPITDVETMQESGGR